MQVPWSYQLGLLREAIQGLSSGVERCVGLEQRGEAKPSKRSAFVCTASDRSLDEKQELRILPYLCYVPDLVQVAAARRCLVAAVLCFAWVLEALHSPAGDP